METAKYKRVVLKLSGEALSGKETFGLDPAVINSIASQVKEIAELDVEIAVVVGGGNIWRGKVGSEMGMDRATADYMGMLATVMNSLALQDSLENVALHLYESIDLGRPFHASLNNLKTLLHQVFLYLPCHLLYHCTCEVLLV